MGMSIVEELSRTFLQRTPVLCILQEGNVILALKNCRGNSLELLLDKIKVSSFDQSNEHHDRKELAIPGLVISQQLWRWS